MGFTSRLRETPEVIPKLFLGAKMRRFQCNRTKSYALVAADVKCCSEMNRVGLQRLTELARKQRGVLNSHLLYQLSYSGSSFGRAKITPTSPYRQRSFTGPLNRCASSWPEPNPQLAVRL